MGHRADGWNIQYIKPRVAHGFAEKQAWYWAVLRPARHPDLRVWTKLVLMPKRLRVYCNKLCDPPYSAAEDTMWRACPHQGGNAQVQRRLSAGRGNGTDASLQRRDSLFQHSIGGVTDAAVNMPGPFQIEQRGGMIARLKYKRSAQVNRHRTSTAARVGGSPSV